MPSNRSNPLDRFVRLFDEALNADTFVRLVMSQPRTESAAAGRVTGRLITLPAGQHLSVTFHHTTRD